MPNFKTALFTGAAILAASLLTTGCANQQPLYYWGGYEDVLHQYYTRPGDMPAARQIEILQRDINTATQRNLKIAPGIYAQLGLAYADLGNQSAAENAFKQEMALFPDSTVLLEGMIKRAAQMKSERTTPTATTPSKSTPAKKVL